MKPQELCLGCELFDDFRVALDNAIRIAVMNMMAKNLNSGTVIGKLDITLNQHVNPETGETIYTPEIQPDVSMKIGTKAKIDLAKQMGFLAKRSAEGVVVGTDQVTMDELIREADNG